jgi:glycosyltransferase involved in cell wall biosynthesis
MSRRLTVITEIIAPYRIPVFNALARLDGINLHVIFLAENDPTQRQWLVYKDEIHFSCQVLPSSRWRVGNNNLLFNWGLVPALRKAAPDAILCGGYNYPAVWRALFWAQRNHVPFLLWTESNTRDFRSGRAWIEFLKTRFLRACDGYVVPGKSSLEYLREYETREEAIFTAPNAVDTQFFAQRAEQVRSDAGARKGFNLPARFVLFVGRLVAEKGVFDLLRAYHALPARLREEIGLVFVGDGAARSSLSSAAAKINPGVVHFAGFVQREDLPVYYALADALVFPTHTDPWGLVVNEAMACGLPVICSRAAGCAEDLVRDYWNGRLVCPGDTEGLASAMHELGCDAPLRSIMGARSREQIAAYSPEACAAGMAAAVLSRGDAAHG